MIKNKKLALLIVWMLLIFIASSIPRARIVQKDLADLILRKIAHIIEYAVLAILSMKNFKNQKLKVWIFVTFYAITDEFHQKFVPGRGPSLRDVLIDSFGAILGIIYVWKYWHKTPKKIKKLLK